MGDPYIYTECLRHNCTNWVVRLRREQFIIQQGIFHINDAYTIIFIWQKTEAFGICKLCLCFGIKYLI